MAGTEESPELQVQAKQSSERVRKPCLDNRDQLPSGWIRQASVGSVRCIRGNPNNQNKWMFPQTTRVIVKDLKQDWNNYIELFLLEAGKPRSGFSGGFHFTVTVTEWHDVFTATVGGTPKSSSTWSPSTWCGTPNANYPETGSAPP